MRLNGYRKVITAFTGASDDTMNLSGIKVSSAEIEEALNVVSGVQETAAVAVSPKDGGPSQLVIYAVLTASEAAPTKQKLHTMLQTALSGHLNPLFRIHEGRPRGCLATNRL